MSEQENAHRRPGLPSERRWEVALAAALTSFCGGLVPLLFGGPSLIEQVVATVSLVLFAVGGPWVFFRAARAVRPIARRSLLRIARRVVAAVAMAYGTVAPVMLLAELVGAWVPVGGGAQPRLIVILFFGPYAILAGAVWLVLVAVDAGVGRRAEARESGSAGLI